MKIAVAVPMKIWCTFFVLSFVGCTKLNETPTSNHETSVVTFSSKTTSAIEYPITFCAFGASGALVKSVTLTDQGDPSDLELVQGDYLMVAIAGSSGYNTSDLNTITTSIVYPGSAKAGALMMGSAYVTLSAATTINITLSYKVAKLSLELLDVPDDVTSVSVSFAPLYNEVNLYGEYTGTAQTQNVTLAKGDGSWSSGEFYLFGDNEVSTVLTINFTSPTGVDSYGYTMSEPLTSATPYAFTGSYSGDVKVDGQFSSEGWNDPQQISFEFGGSLDDGGSSGGSGDSDDLGDSEGGDTTQPDGDVGLDYVFSVSSIPSAVSVWNDHVVFAVDQTSDDEATLYLVSVDQWSGVYVSDWSSSADQYSEGNLIEWSQPSSAEAKILQNVVVVDNRLDDLNKLITSLGGTSIISSSEVRYLCDEGSNCFSLDSSSTSISTTSSLRAYNMLLVREVKVKIAQ